MQIIFFKFQNLIKMDELSKQINLVFDDLDDNFFLPQKFNYKVKVSLVDDVDKLIKLTNDVYKMVDFIKN